MVRAGIRSTMRDRLGDVFRRDHPARVAGRGLPGIRAEFRIHAARHDGTDAHVVVAVVQHHGLGETVEPELGGVVAGAAAERVLAGQAGDVDDEAAAALGEPRQRLARAVERTVQIQVDVAVPLFRRHVADFSEHALRRRC